jgi:hypothetical protein
VRQASRTERERVEDMELGVMTADDDDVPVSVHGWYVMVDVSVRSTRRICMSMFAHVGMHVSVCMYAGVCRCMQVYMYACMHAVVHNANIMIPLARS